MVVNGIPTGSHQGFPLGDFHDELLRCQRDFPEPLAFPYTQGDNAAVIAKPLDNSLASPDNAPMPSSKTPAKERLVFECSPEFRRQVEREAEYEGLTLSSFMRRALTLYMRRRADDTPTD